MTDPIGGKRWAIPEGHIPGWGHGADPALASHETACLLNSSDDDAHVEITLFFSDREPAGPYVITVPARRTRHVRFNDLEDPAPVPKAHLPPASSFPTWTLSSSTLGWTLGRAGLSAVGERAVVDHRLYARRVILRALN